ncbi:AMP-binding protein [Croceimicrobium hydrocarbonivorans]|uniref:AMP-binding protein n=1 Tax=Croceimicrobium hydrocarbonivorans TaxID=2761580 RepID=A0A7H0VDG7_9FLAO|nr:AMP-binding protein [Croceimicrobium hydrocarbonivorans]QNR23765.1 AMP-binding protein [Croceimicrobium hydrocarbonivorans]
MKIKLKNFASPTYLQEIEALHAWFLSDQSEFVISSSGTTGPAQDMHFKREAIFASAQMSVDFFGLNSQSRILLSLPLNKIGGMMLAIRAFLADAEIVAVDPVRNPLAQIPTDLKIDFVSMVPNQFVASKEYWSQVKTFLIGGGPLSNAVLSLVDEIKPTCEIWHSYASTETLSHVALKSLYPNREEAYQAMEGVSFGVNEEQCLQISASALALDKLQTKDIVELIDAQHFIWKGRKDNVILSGGLKLYPEEIENQLKLEVPGFLWGQEDIELGQRMVWVMAESDYQASIPNTIKSQLQGPNRPKAILLVPKLEFTATDKIKREASLQKGFSLIAL